MTADDRFNKSNHHWAWEKAADAREKLAKNDAGQRPDQVANLKDGLRRARDKIIEQQMLLMSSALKLEALNKAPYLLATALVVADQPFRPEPGARITVLKGNAKGRTLLIGAIVGRTALCIDEKEEKQRPRSLMDALGGAQPTVHEITWTRHWRDVMGPADGRLGRKMVTVAVNGQNMDVEMPDGLDVQEGGQLKLNAKTMQIVDVVRHRDSGPLATVTAILDKHFCEVELRGETMAIRKGRFKRALKAGDRVQLDESGKVVVHVFEQEASGRFDHTQETSVTWEMIGGQAEAKLALREALVLPYEQADLFAHYGQTPPKGVLLWGPPGCGKTTLAKAVATEVARRHGSAAKGAFMYVKGSEILDKWLGNSEAAVRKIFAQARAFKKKHGFPAVICFDEAESVMRPRGGDGIGSSLMDTLVPAFLAEMDGLTDSGAIVILLTNRPDMLDEAITRAGRIDRKIEVKRPDFAETEMIFNVHLRGLPLAHGVTLESLSKAATEALFSDDQVLRTYATTTGGHLDFTLMGLRSGGLVEGVVKAAKASAIRRDIAGGTRTGLAACDIASAIAEKLHENKNLTHADALEEFVKHHAAAPLADAVAAAGSN